MITRLSDNLGGNVSLPFPKSIAMTFDMEDTKTQNGESTVIAHGLIADYVGFKNKINAEIRRLCGIRKAWATEEATELLVFVVDEYVAQMPIEKLEDGSDNTDAKGRPVPMVPDAGDLKEMFSRYANMNAVNNRLAEAKLIDRNERKGRKVGSDLL